MMQEEINNPAGLFNQDLPQNDISGRILGELFGQDWTTLMQTVRSGEELSGASSLLITLLQTLSTVALSIGSVIMIYTIFYGVVGTAWHGKAGGKMSLWTPIRGAVAVGMLIPTAKGLNILMVLILTCIGGSVSLANHLAEAGHNFLTDTGGKLTVQAPPSVRGNIEEVAQEITQNLTAQHYMSYKLGQTFDTMYIVIPPSEGHEQYTISFLPSLESSLNESDMGSVQIPCLGSKPDTICKARAEAMLDLIKDLTPVARNLSVQILTKKEREAAGAPAPMPITGQEIRGAANRYLATMQEHIPQILEQAEPQFQEDVQEFANQAQKDGWAMLGSYYWTLARMTEHVHDLSGSLPRATQGDFSAQLANSWEDPAFEALMSSTEEVAKRELSERQEAAKISDEGLWSKVTNMVRKFVFLGTEGPVQAYSQKLRDGNPLMVLSDMGHYMVGAAQGLTGAAVAVGTAGAATEAGLESTLAELLTFGGSAAAGRALGFLAMAAMTISLLIASALFSAGIMLAFYLPALPWILWMSAILGWLILIVETLFAAPLWAVGHLIPEGDGMTGQHGRQGYMLLLGVLARPPLMVAGFFASLIIFSLFGNFVGHCFSIFISSAEQGHVTGITTMIMQVIILTAAMVAFSHKIFSLINNLPERVVNWIGQLNQNLGEAADEGRAHSIVVAGGGVVSNSSGAAGAGSGAGAAAKREKEKEETAGKVQNGDLSQ
jgi:conjugal transfer/type IV secretion protein DotA/TraY